MAQKTNPIILRLGSKNNQWKIKYFGKNVEEIGFYNYQNLEIKKYFKIFLNRIGLLLHDYTFEYKINNIKFFISYYSLLKLPFFLKNNIKIKKNYFAKYNKFNSFQNFKNRQSLKINNFLDQFLQSLSIFTAKISIILIKFQNLNKNLFFKLTKTEYLNLKKKIFLLRKFKKNKFFKEILNIVFITIQFKNTGNLLINVIINELKKIKKHNFFLIFLKYILFLFLNTKFSKINGLKIGIKGKLNSLTRAKNKFITIGSFSVQSICKNINYFKKTAFMTNGSLTIKIWLNQK